MGEILFWAEQTSEALAARAARDPVAVLPVAAIEQHGPHLPLGTDAVIGAGLLDAACAVYAGASDLLRLPMIELGASSEHAAYAGTLSRPAEAMTGAIRAAGEGVARAGIRRLVIVNSHGGNKAAIDSAALALRCEHDLFVVKADYSRFAPPADTLSAEELRHGVHGGALETALMLYLAPHLVHGERAAAFDSLGKALADEGYVIGPGGEASFAWRAEDLHPAGVAGDARAATAAIGARLVAHYADRLARVFDDAARFDPDRLGGTGGVLA